MRSSDSQENETPDVPDWRDEPFSDEMMDDKVLRRVREAIAESLDF